MSLNKLLAVPQARVRFISVLHITTFLSSPESALWLAKVKECTLPSRALVVDALPADGLFIYVLGPTIPKRASPKGAKIPKFQFHLVCYGTTKFKMSLQHLPSEENLQLNEDVISESLLSFFTLMVRQRMYCSFFIVI
jgi:hypothetical protein